jgi:hypothetical protein
MSKGERLIWELFEMVRELMPATAANSERFQRWSEKFHELEIGSGSNDRHEPVDVADHDADEDEVHEEVHEDPHEHGSPVRPKTQRRKR